jgi:hypothetical protein
MRKKSTKRPRSSPKGDRAVDLTKDKTETAWPEGVQAYDEWDGAGLGADSLNPYQRGAKYRAWLSGWAAAEEECEQSGSKP